LLDAHPYSAQQIFSSCARKVIAAATASCAITSAVFDRLRAQSCISLPASNAKLRITHLIGRSSRRATRSFHYGPIPLQGVEPSHQLGVSASNVVLARASRLDRPARALSFRLQIGTCVVIGGFQSRMPEPVPGHDHIDTGGDELNTDAVAPGVRHDGLGRERPHMSCSCQHVWPELDSLTQQA
jgi:hypothetical protein